MKTLIEILNEYFTETYSFKKKIIENDGSFHWVTFEFSTHEAYFDQYISFYKNIDSIGVLFEMATKGVFTIVQEGKTFTIRHPHQEVFTDKNNNKRGISIDIATEVHGNLLKRINDICLATTFDEIITIVTDCKVKGFGELAIYDTSIRIAAYLNIEPTRVYLHAGTREGIKYLEQKGYFPEGTSLKSTLLISQFPTELQRLKSDQLQHMLCCKKSEFKEELEFCKKLP